MKFVIIILVLLGQISCSQGQYVSVAEDEVYYLSAQGNHRYEAVIYPAGNNVKRGE